MITFSPAGAEQVPPPTEALPAKSLSEPLSPGPAGLSPAEQFLIDYLDVPIDQVDTRRYPGAYSNGGLDTPYDKSGMSKSIIDPNSAAAKTPLFGQRDPHYAIKHERYEHRVVCFLKAEGYSNREIADKMELSPVAVSNIVRQPWAQQTILEIIQTKGGDAVQRLLEGAAADSVLRLIEERDNEQARPEARIMAADKLLDRLYGKPNQPIEHRELRMEELSDKELESIVARGVTSGTATSAPAEE